MKKDLDNYKRKREWQDSFIDDLYTHSNTTNDVSTEAMELQLKGPMSLDLKNVLKTMHTSNREGLWFVMDLLMEQQREISLLKKLLEGRTTRAYVDEKYEKLAKAQISITEDPSTNRETKHIGLKDPEFNADISKLVQEEVTKQLRIQKGQQEQGGIEGKENIHRNFSDNENIRKGEYSYDNTCSHNNYNNEDCVNGDMRNENNNIKNKTFYMNNKTANDTSEIPKDYLDYQLSRRPTWTEVEAILRDKADISMIERLGIHKANISDIERIDNKILHDYMTSSEIQAMMKREVKESIENTLGNISFTQQLQHGLEEVHKSEIDRNKCYGPAAHIDTRNMNMHINKPMSDSVDSLLDAIRVSQVEKSQAITSSINISKNNKVYTDSNIISKIDIEKALAVCRTQLHADMCINREHLKESLESQVNKLRIEILSQIETEVSAIQREFSDVMCGYNNKIEKFRSSFDRSNLELVQVLNRKAYKVDITKALQLKIDRDEVNTSMQNYCTKREVSDLLLTKANADELHETITSILSSISQVNRDFVNVRSELDEKKKEIVREIEDKMHLKLETLSEEIKQFKSSNLKQCKEIKNNTGHFESLEKDRGLTQDDKLLHPDHNTSFSPPLPSVFHEDWKVALGEATLTLQDLIEDRPTREEIVKVLSTEIGRLEQDVSFLNKNNKEIKLKMEKLEIESSKGQQNDLMIKPKSMKGDNIDLHSYLNADEGKDNDKTNNNNIQNKSKNHIDTQNEVHEEREIIAKGLEINVKKDPQSAFEELASKLYEQENLLTSLTHRLKWVNTGGRWLWRSGNLHVIDQQLNSKDDSNQKENNLISKDTLKRGNVCHLVPWEVEVMNTSTQHFKWNKDTYNIVTKIPGLYYIAAGFFTQDFFIKNLGLIFKIDILVNHETAFSICTYGRDNTNSTTNSRSLALDKPQKDRTTGLGYNIFRKQEHTSGNITCINVQEYLALPANASLSVNIEVQKESKKRLEMQNSDHSTAFNFDFELLQKKMQGFLTLNKL